MSLHVTLYKCTYKLQILSSMMLTSSKAESQHCPSTQTLCRLFLRTFKSLTLALVLHLLIY